jgi:hypothetical protein
VKKRIDNKANLNTLFTTTTTTKPHPAAAINNMADIIKRTSTTAEPLQQQVRHRLLPDRRDVSGVVSTSIFRCLVAIILIHFCSLCNEAFGIETHIVRW